MREYERCDSWAPKTHAVLLAVIRDRLNLEARIEAFNVTNTPKFQNPDGNRASAEFMTVTATDPNRPERQVRVALRPAF